MMNTLTMNTISRLTASFFVASLAVAPALAAVQDPKPITESVTIQATIEAIDKTKKIVTLKGPKGNLVDVDASGAARFDQLKVGDVVTATYSESLAVHIRKPGEPAPPAASADVTQRASGPGGTATQRQTATVVIQAIDPQVPSVTVKTTDGRVMSFRIQNPKNIETLKVGDTVDVTFTQALLLKADPPK